MHVATVPTLADVLALSAALDSRADAVWAHLHSAAPVISEAEYVAAVAERDSLLEDLRPVRRRVDELLEAGELPSDDDLAVIAADLTEAVASADAAAERFRRYGEVKAGTEHVAGRVAEGLHQLTAAAAVLPEHQRDSWSRIVADGYESLQHAAAIANERQWVAAIDLLTSLEAQIQAALNDVRTGAPAVTSAPAAPTHDAPTDHDALATEEEPTATAPTAEELEDEASRLRTEGSQVVAEFTRLRAHVAEAVAAGWETQLRGAASAIMPGAAAAAWARDPHAAAAQLAESAQTLDGIKKALARVAAYEDGS